MPLKMSASADTSGRDSTVITRRVAEVRSNSAGAFMPFVSSIFRMFPSVRMGNVREPSMYLGAGMTSYEANYFVDHVRVDKIIFY